MIARIAVTRDLQVHKSRHDQEPPGPTMKHGSGAQSFASSTHVCVGMAALLESCRALVIQAAMALAFGVPGQYQLRP